VCEVRDARGRIKERARLRAWAYAVSQYGGGIEPIGRTQLKQLAA